MLRKNQNNQPVTKKDLEKTLDGQSRIILEAVDFGFKKVKRDIAELKKNARQSLTKQDRICKQLTDLQQESKMGTRLYKRHDKKLEDHEGRISYLELKIQPVRNKI